MNQHKDYVTTSSCSGRIALFAEPVDAEDKTKGIGRWLFVKHGEASISEIELNLKKAKQDDCVYIRHEPFVMHVQCRNLESAQNLLQSALGVGFRESGIIAGRKKIMCGIRTTSTILTVPIFMNSQSLLRDRDALQTVVNMCVDRFRRNVRMIKRLCKGLEHLFGVTEMRDAARRVVIKNEEEIVKIHMKELHLTEQRMLNRWGHSVCALSSNSGIVFGGQCEDGRRHNDAVRIVMTEPDRITLNKISFNTEIPTPRAYQTLSSVRFENQMIPIMFGGRQSPQKPLSDMWALIPTSNSWTWQEVISTTKCKSWPQARYRHTCVDLGHGRVLILGGRDASVVFDDAWIVKLQFVESVLSVVSCTCVVNKEFKRFSHVALRDENTVWVSGGYEDVDGQKIRSTILRLNIKDDSIVLSDVRRSSVGRATHNAAILTKDNEKILLELGGCSSETPETTHGDRFMTSTGLGTSTPTCRVEISNTVSKNSVLVRACSMCLRCKDKVFCVLIGGGGLLFNSSVWSPCCVLQVSNGWTFLQGDVGKSSKTHASPPRRIMSTKSQACVVVPRRGAKLLRIAFENAKMYVVFNYFPTFIFSNCVTRTGTTLRGACARILFPRICLCWLYRFWTRTKRENCCFNYA